MARRAQHSGREMATGNRPTGQEWFEMIG